MVEIGLEKVQGAGKIDSPMRRTWRRFRRHKLAMIGSAAVIILVLMAVFAPVISPNDPVETQIRNTYASPSSDHWLGTDKIGRDVWARVIYGTRISLSVGIVAVGISIIISLLLGTASGYYGGVVDMLIMRFTDIIMSVPSLLAIMAVVVLVGPSIFNVMAVIGLLGWPGTTRLVRGQILSVREWDYVLAARCLGVPNKRIMLVHVLPNVVAPLVVAATLGVAGAILTEAGLSFLGLGTPPPTPSWGSMLNAARSFTVLERYAWVWVPPGTMILITVLAINFIGDGLRDAMDPRMNLL